MYIKAKDYFYQQELTGNINILRKTIHITKEDKKGSVYSYIPFKFSSYRVYQFPFTDKGKVLKAVKTSLVMELKDISPYEIDFYQKENKVFCVITRKELIEQLLEAYPNLELLDSDIFCLIRLAKHNGIARGVIYHFYEDFVLYIKFSDSFPLEVRTYPKTDISVEKDALLSGKIPEQFKSERVLNNPTKDPQLNILFGLLLRPIYQEGIDFLKRENKGFLDILVKSVIFIVIVLFIINIGLSVQKYFLNKQLLYVKNKEKEIFIKYFGSSKVIDPLSQAKGLVSVKDNYFQKDGADILYHIAQSKRSIPSIKITKITVENTEFYIKGFADSIENIDRFKTILNRKFRQVSVEESKKDASGKIRFSIKGEG